MLRYFTETTKIVVPSTTSPEPLLLTAPEAAKALALSPRKLWSLTAGGDIPSVRIGRAVRDAPEDPARFVRGAKVSQR